MDLVFRLLLFSAVLVAVPLALGGSADECRVAETSLAAAASPPLLSFKTPGAGPSIKDCSNFSWYYCPRDPGCATYAMSAHRVTLSKRGKPTIHPSGEVTIFVDGVTTLTAVPAEMSYMIYALNGGNAGGGPVVAGKGHYWDHGATLDLDHAKAPGPGLRSFRLEVPFNVSSKAFNGTGRDLLFNIGLDVFLKRGGADEGICLQISNAKYVALLTRPSASQRFDFLCDDHGNGTFGYPAPLPNPDQVHHLAGCNERGRGHSCGCIAHCVPTRQALLTGRAAVPGSAR